MQLLCVAPRQNTPNRLDALIDRTGLPVLLVIFNLLLDPIVVVNTRKIADCASMTRRALLLIGNQIGDTVGQHAVKPCLFLRGYGEDSELQWVSQRRGGEKWEH